MDVPFSADSKYVASIDATGYLALWNVQRRVQVAATNLEPDLAAELRMPADARSFFLHSNGQTREFEIPTLRLLRQYPFKKRRFASDRSFSIFVRDDTVVRQETGTGLERPLGRVPYTGSALEVSPDQTLVAVSIEEQGSFGVMLFSTSQPAAPRRLLGHSRQVWCLAFSPDSRMLATGTWDGVIGLWDLRQSRPLTFLRAHTGYIWRVAFSPDGRTLASGADDAAIRFWNLASLQEAGVIRPSAAQVSALAFSPDNQHLAVAAGGKLLLFTAPAMAGIATTENERTRNR
jgi:WD40 repeat protein